MTPLAKLTLLSLVGAAALVGIAALQIRSVPSTTQSAKQETDIGLEYVVDSVPSGASKKLTLCEIASLNGLDEDARARTFEVNAIATRTCADPQVRYEDGTLLRLVVAFGPNSTRPKYCKNICLTTR